MSNSYHLDGINDADQIEADLATHPEGIVAILQGNDVARIVPLSAEERAWREALRGAGSDPDAVAFATQDRDEYLPIHAEVTRAIYGDSPAAHTGDDAQGDAQAEPEDDDGAPLDNAHMDDSHMGDATESMPESLPESLDVSLSEPEPEPDASAFSLPDWEREVAPALDSDPQPNDDRVAEPDWDESWPETQES